MLSRFYQAGFDLLTRGQFDVVNDPLYLMLAGPAYEPDAAVHSVLGDVSDEIKTAGYRLGGKRLQNVRIAFETTEVNGRPRTIVAVYSDDCIWAWLRETTIQTVIAYCRDDPPEKSPLLLYWQLPSPQTISGNSFRVNLSSTPLMDLVANVH